MRIVYLYIIIVIMLFDFGTSYAETYRVPVSHILTHFDPIEKLSLQEAIVGNQIFDSLVTFSKGMHITPALAQQWEISENGKTYSFILRKARFHNGDLVTSYDVDFSLKRLLASKESSQSLHSALSGIVGASSFIWNRSTSISGIKIISNNEFSITLTKPNPNLLFQLARIDAGIVSKRSIENHFIGAGPFQFISSNSTCTLLKKFNNYYKNEAKLDFLQFMHYQESDLGAVVNDFNNNELDEMPLYGNIKGEITVKNITISSVPMFHIVFYGFNTKHGITNESTIRHSLANAINKHELSNEIWRNYTSPMYDFLPVGLPGAFPGASTDFTSKQSNFIDNSTIRFAIYGKSKLIDEELNRIKSFWSAIGVKTIVQKYASFTEYLTCLQDGNFDVFRFGWGAELPDSRSLLAELVHSASPGNYMRYNNSAVDNLLDRAKNEYDGLKRFNIIREICVILNNDMPYLPIFQMKMTRAYQPGISGQELSPLGPAYVDYSTFEKATP